ncbi:hypothetical protein RSWS8N_08535 [Cereibacter sphaeroides WS8N]|nr:hypothetical protein RSWS8N_08535 [Cereibacter sphaeroides WS8N]
MQHLREATLGLQGYRALLGLYATAEKTFSDAFPRHFSRIMDRLRSSGGGS